MQKKLFLQAIGKFLLEIVLVEALIFVPAGTFAYPGGRLLMGLLFVPMLLAGLVMPAKNPALPESRLRGKEQEPCCIFIIIFIPAVILLCFSVPVSKGICVQTGAGMFRSPSIRAEFCAIGGDDTIRLLPHIDFDVLRDNPKIFTGYSVSTVNHFMMHKAGLVSYYGLAVMTTLSEYVAVNEYTRTSMEQILFDPRPTLDIPCSDFCSYETDKVWWNEANRNTPTPRFPNIGYEILQGSGTVTGELLGGCTDVFLQLFGTSLWPSPEEWRGKLLLLETSEWNMDPLLFTWILRNLAAQGLFRVLSGILVGKPAYREKEDAYKAALLQVIGKEAGCPDLPILRNVNAGHAYPTGVFPLGLRYRIDCGEKRLTLLEPGTA